MNTWAERSRFSGPVRENARALEYANALTFIRQRKGELNRTERLWNWYRALLARVQPREKTRKALANCERERAKAAGPTHYRAPRPVTLHQSLSFWLDGASAGRLSLTIRAEWCATAPINRMKLNSTIVGMLSRLGHKLILTAEKS